MPNLLLVRPARNSYPFRPLSLALLSAIAKRRGWRRRLLDAGLEEHPSAPRCHGNPDLAHPPGMLQGLQDRALMRVVSETIAEFSPDLVAITVLSDNRFTAAAITKAIKQSDPRIPVLWGGAEPTISPKRALLDYKADAVCRGEGSLAFDDVLKSYEDNGDISAIPNIWSLGENGIVHNPVRPLNNDLDSLPFLDMELFPEFQGTPEGRTEGLVSADHMITHGCPSSCSYCINAFYHSLYRGQYRIRHYSPRRIVQELQWMKEQYGVRFFNFHDEDFLLKDVEYLRELCDMYSRDVGLPFSVMAAPRSVTEEKAALLKRMNCSGVAIGIETGESGHRKALLGRPDSPRDIIRSTAILKRNGIRISSFNMIALPYYSRDAYRKTVGLNRAAEVDAPYASFFYPYEGTRMRDIAIMGGFFDPSDSETAVHRLQVPALHFPDLRADDLKGMREVFHLWCGLPDEYAMYIRMAEKQDRTGQDLRGMLNHIHSARLHRGCSPSAMDRRDTDYLHQLDTHLRERTDLAQ